MTPSEGNDDDTTDDAGGQVSEVTRLDPAAADTPISDSDQVAGYPESESGEPETGEEIGPDARTGSEQRDHRGHLED